MEIILIDYDDNWFSTDGNNAIIQTQRLVEMVPSILTKQSNSWSTQRQPQVVDQSRQRMAPVGRAGTLYGGIAR
jgi:hypothetical protein